jgi:hypothetical protein
MGSDPVVVVISGWYLKDVNRDYDSLWESPGRPGPGSGVPSDHLTSWTLRAQSWGTSRPVSELRSDVRGWQSGTGRGGSPRSTGAGAAAGETR